MPQKHRDDSLVKGGTLLVFYQKCRVPWVCFYDFQPKHLSLPFLFVFVLEVDPAAHPEMCQFLVIQRLCSLSCLIQGVGVIKNLRQKDSGS